MSRMKYLQRRANRFEFRFPLPDDLAGKPVPKPWPETVASFVNPKSGRYKTELIRSLRTSDAKAAERAVLAHIAEAHALVDRARAHLTKGPVSSLGADEVAIIVRGFEAEILRGDEALRTEGIGLDLNRPGGPSRHDGAGMSDDDLRLYEGLVVHLDGEVRSQLAKMRPGDLIGFSVNKAMQDRGVVLHPDDPAWRQLELEFLKAQRRAVDAIKKRLAGDDVPTPVHAPEVSSSGLTLRQAFARWADGGGRGARKPSDGAMNEARCSVDRFVELHKDLPITAITKAHGRAFRDALAKLPARLPEELRRLPLPELIRRDLSRYPKRGAQTVNKTLALLGGIMARADKDGYFEALPSWSNPFHVAFEIAPSEREPYEPFSADELRRLFASPVFTDGSRPLGGRGEAAYWFPLIALYSGARRTEIAQLRVRDVRQGAAGIWFFDITDEGDEQSVKTTSSVRSVPIHRELIRLGILAYVEARARGQSPDAVLWPGFEAPIATKVKAWTKWFARYLGEHVVEHPAKTFHSFRHTFKRACREAGIPEEIHHALTGHAAGGVGRRYGRERRSDGSLDCGVPLRRLREEIDKIGTFLESSETDGDVNHPDCPAPITYAHA